MAVTYQSKGFVCKTVSRDVLDYAIRFAESVTGARWAYALHEPTPPKVSHWHLVCLFEDRVYWKAVYDFAMDHDTCSSTATCKKPRKAVRYLLHLDNPEKHPVPFESLVSGGCWGPDELSDWLETSSAATSLVTTLLGLWRDGLTPLEAFSRLVSFGFEPFQISSSLQAYTRICEFWTKYAPNSRGMGAAPRPHLEQTFSTPQQKGEETQFPTIKAKNKTLPSDVTKCAKTEIGTARKQDEEKTCQAAMRESASNERSIDDWQGLSSSVPSYKVFAAARFGGSCFGKIASNKISPSLCGYPPTGI